MSKMPELSPELKEVLNTWEPFSTDALIILLDEVAEKEGSLYLPEKTKRKLTLNIGTGWVIAKCSDDKNLDPRLVDVMVGDRVKFTSGTTINAELGRNVPEYLRCHFLHIQNLIMIHRCGKVLGDFEKDIQES